MRSTGLEEFKQHTARKLSDVRCPDHKQSPRVNFRGSSLRDVTIQVSACCDKLSAMANERLAERAIPAAEQSQDLLALPHARG